jgi:hypothetical protein
MLRFYVSFKAPDFKFKVEQDSFGRGRKRDPVDDSRLPVSSDNMDMKLYTSHLSNVQYSIKVCLLR